MSRKIKLMYRKLRIPAMWRVKPFLFSNPPFPPTFMGDHNDKEVKSQRWNRIKGRFWSSVQTNGSLTSPNDVDMGSLTGINNPSHQHTHILPPWWVSSQLSLAQLGFILVLATGATAISWLHERGQEESQQAGHPEKRARLQGGIGWEEGKHVQADIPPLPLFTFHWRPASLTIACLTDNLGYGPKF